MHIAETKLLFVGILEFDMPCEIIRGLSCILEHIEVSSLEMWPATVSTSFASNRTFPRHAKRGTSFALDHPLEFMMEYLVHWCAAAREACLSTKHARRCAL